jgi:hypothetical protein
MLRFRITQDKDNLDSKALEVTDHEISEDVLYNIPADGEDRASDITDKEEHIFYVKDLYNIQDGAHINAFSTIKVGSDSDKTAQEYTVYKDLVVQSADKVENTFSVYLDKEVPLTIKDISIETRYMATYWSTNKWVLEAVDKAWIDGQYTLTKQYQYKTKDKKLYGVDLEEPSFDNFKYLSTNDVGYGLNPRRVYSAGGCGDGRATCMLDEYTVCYYENSSWKTIMLKDNGSTNDAMEGCLSVDKTSITFASFHQYDTTVRNTVLLDKRTLYYMHENYLEFTVSPTHYFMNSVEEYVYDKDERMVQTEYGRSVIKTMNYPFVYFYMKYNDGSSSGPITIKIKKEVNLVANSVFRFNYDEFTHDFSNENDVVDVDKPIYPVVIGEEATTVSEDETDRIKALVNKLINNDVTHTVYRRFTTEEIQIIENKIFPYGYEVEYQTGYNVEEDEENQGFYNIMVQHGVSGGIELQRENYLFGENAAYMLTYDTAVNVIQIPISQKFETDLHHNDALQNNYVENAQQNAINPIIDMEKDVYIPAISKEVLTSDKQINSDYVECFKIIFNLHFRKHRDRQTTNGTKQEWQCQKTDYWNGTQYEDGVLKLRPNVGDEDKESEEPMGYFSYYSNDEGKCYQSYQSDLLSFLGFSNDDVKYQKSKLKKSFLRVSFYDSENVGNQNLLCSSTIFLDSGNLFAKYIKNIETVGDNMVTIGSSFIEEDSIVSYDCNGVRVNREPMENSVDKVGLDDNIGDLEDLRLSSQFFVTDKYSSKRSSEGFYFYTYKTNDNGVYPSDIYMRVEFNHAVYGRTIPFMMPYVRDSERNTEDGAYTGKTKIKTFQDICNDWSAVDQDGNTKAEEDIGYGSVKYLKYTHIKWKYRYDKDTQKHIYYLDPELYGESVTSNNGHGHNIILNLYEGKIR